MKNKLKIILKTILILIISSIIGFILLFISYNIPNKNVKNNIKEYINADNLLVDDLPKITSTNLDNYTDSIMLSEILVDGDNKLELAASNKYFLYEDPLIGLVNYFKNKMIFYVNYERYWHGYSLPLKILLCIFNLSQVKILNYYFQIILIILICINLKKKKLKNYILPFLISLCFMMPMTIYKNLSFSVTYNLMLIISLFIIKDYKKLKNKMYYVFLIIGILTSYFDFLTAPLITLEYPLLFYLLLDDSNTKDKIIKIIKLSIFWIIGYLGMWFLKWVISSIILHKNILLDAYNNILIRTSNKVLDEKVNILNVIFQNIKISLLGINIYILLMLILLLIINFYKCLFKNDNIDIFIKIIPFIIISIIPFLWYLLTLNHSIIHARFTYKILSITIFSICIIIVKLYEKIKK